MRLTRLATIVAPALVFAACAANPEKGTLASLHQVPADTAEVRVPEGLDKATQSYQRFLDETPESALTPDAMRRLADLKIEKEYGLLADGKPAKMPAPQVTSKIEAPAAQRKVIAAASPANSERELERRATNLPSMNSADELPEL